MKKSVYGHENSLGKEDSFSIRLNDTSVKESKIQTGIIPEDGQVSKKYYVF